MSTSTTNTNKPLGVVIFARHGDRQGFYQSPSTYTATATQITPLGEAQEYQLGDLMRRTYADPTSEWAVTNLSYPAMAPSQLNSTVDGGGEGGVIYDSAVAFWQGFYPPTTLGNASSTTLANGTTITSPLNGYQYLQINAVQPTDDVDFEGYSNCNAWTTHTNNFYASPAFLAKQAEYQSFLTMLANSGVVGGRNVTLSNMWNIFDFINVKNIHNATFAALLNSTGESTFPIVRDLANYHEYGAFTDVNATGIGNVAARTFLSRIIPALQAIAVPSPTVKVAHFQIAYKPFLGLFNLTNVAASGQFPNPDGIVDYASVAAYEVRHNMAGTGYDIRFGFKNGTTDGEATNLTYYPMFGESSIDMDLNTFITNLQPSVIANNQDWCNACNNTVGGFCQLYIEAAAGVAALNSSSNGATVGSHDKVSPVGAGFIGAAVTAVLGAALFAFLVFSGLITLGKKRRVRNDGVPLRDGSFSSSKL
ncbi:hypothetical protein MNV49_002036 [Pseudohyphozyma bogoriensis]|nr:hypothetical protein MNV49_002036 [Pseudohyphozyma bogoriensis]